MTKEEDMIKTFPLLVFPSLLIFMFLSSFGLFFFHFLLFYFYFFFLDFDLQDLPLCLFFIFFSSFLQTKEKEAGHEIRLILMMNDGPSLLLITSHALFRRGTFLLPPKKRSNIKKRRREWARR